MDFLLEYGLLGAFDTTCNCFGDDDSIVGDGFSMSFLEVQSHSQDIGAQLVHLLGVSPRDNVLFIIDGEEEAEGAEVCALLGVWRAQAVFVPVGRQSLAAIIASTDPTAAIVVARGDDAAVVRELASLGVHRTVCLTPGGQLVADAADIRTDLPPPPDERQGEEEDRDVCCYILHTSGSTGAPKGVRGTVRGLMSRLAWQHSNYPLEPHDVCLRRTPLTFVDSFVEILCPLLSGVALYFPPADFKALGLAGAVEQLSQQGVSRITVLPSQLAQALRLNPLELTTESWPTLALCTVSGEPCPAGLVAQFRLAFPDCLLLNLYGSTEVAGDICAAVLSPASVEQALPLHDGLVPIGRCMVGQCFIVTTAVKSGDGVDVIATASEGEKGELFYAGDLVADGYHKLPQETSERFLIGAVIDGIAERGRVFRTGDVCSKRGDIIYWHGRMDLQCKLAGGLRVELEGVEAALRDALGGSGGGGGGALAALAVDWGGAAEEEVGTGMRIVLVVEATTAGTDIASATLRRLQKASGLPGAFVPVFAFSMPALPRNATGKVDRRQILEFFQAHRELASSNRATLPQALPPSAVSLGPDFWGHRVATIVATVLPSVRSVAEIDLQRDSFFSLGGDSVAFIEFSWRIRQELNITVGKALWREPLLSILVELQRAEQEAAAEAGAASSSSSSRAAKKPRVLGNESGQDVLLRVEWSLRMTRCIDAAPLLIDGAVYVGDHNGRFVCVSADTGDVSWGVQLRASDDSVEMHIEGAAVPSSDGKTIYVTSYGGKSVDGTLPPTETSRVAEVRHAGPGPVYGILWALDLPTGGKVWSVALPGEIKSRVAVVGEGSEERVWVSSYAGMYEIAAKDGSVLGCYFESLSFYAAPVASPSHLYCASTSGQLVCISLADTSEAVWGGPIDGTFFLVDGAASAENAPIFATPALIHHEGHCRLVYGCIDATLRCVSERGMKVWANSDSTRPIFSSCCFAAKQVGAIFGSHDNWLRSVDVTSGRLQWETDCGSVVFSSPAAFLSDQLVVAATTGGDVLVLDTERGEVKARLRLPGEIYSSPTVDAGSGIYVGCRDDCLYKLQLQPG